MRLEIGMKISHMRKCLERGENKGKGVRNSKVCMGQQVAPQVYNVHENE